MGLGKFIIISFIECFYDFFKGVVYIDFCDIKIFFFKIFCWYIGFVG